MYLVWLKSDRDRWMDGWKKNFALTHPYHAEKSCSKFSLILPSGLRGDNVTDGHIDRRTDGGVHNIPTL